MSTPKPFIESFLPVISADAEVLILGSMPGIASLEAQQYYAHPRNAFWSIIEALFGIDRSLEYDQRLERLLRCRVGLWDVLRYCQREGSLDQAIDDRTLQVHDFKQLLQNYTGIKAIFFNGAKSEQLFRKHVIPTLTEDMSEGLLYLQRLPSTSPAHASQRFEQKLAAWRVILDSLSSD